MKNLRLWIIGYVVALAAAVLSPLASSAPDGLESVAETYGFADRAAEEPFYRIIPDYLFPGIENEAVATILAGVIGVTLVYALVAGLTYLAYRRKAKAGSQL